MFGIQDEVLCLSCAPIAAAPFPVKGFVAKEQQYSESRSSAGLFEGTEPSESKFRTGDW